jgi:hypothetical protein
MLLWSGVHFLVGGLFFVVALTEALPILAIALMLFALCALALYCGVALLRNTPPAMYQAWVVTLLGELAAWIGFVLIVFLIARYARVTPAEIWAAGLWIWNLLPLAVTATRLFLGDALRRQQREAFAQQAAARSSAQGPTVEAMS